MTTSLTPLEAPEASAPSGKPGKPGKSGKDAKDGGATGGAGWFTYLALGFIVLLWILPTVGIVLTSFRTRDDAASGGWWELLMR